EGWATIGQRAKVNASVGTFVPKPHTPFQWVPCDTLEQIEAKQELLKREVRGRGLKLSWSDPKGTLLESWLSRGDRRMGEVVHGAWQRGAKFDAWSEHFDFDAWIEAFQAAGLDPDFYTHRQRPIDEAFPWDHISAGVRKKFLLEDYKWSLEGQTRVDCREQCFACGILPTFNELRRDNPGEGWKCPEVQ
ncbi:MAG: B12-binding domain-containing radical SAM protein, partial [Chloroflexi bacterium]|nr:B12-binding domain-containing radical SAM protein [Chloroflexota bacterium]